ncbi:MAG: ARMT1-like domain-containing protein [bacterium]|nr:ARMT1-like domain-containing protein [bacterium]MDD5756605.1 ARMT1-like domain-containing protein [bacterium]
MNTYIDCIPCFFRQLIEGARIIGVKPKRQKQIIDEFARIIQKSTLRSSPTEIISHGYHLLTKASTTGDPYKEIKQKSNNLALGLFAEIKHRVKRANDRLLTAVELAIAGNIIDFGIKNNLNVHEELKKIMAAENKSIHNKSIFHYAQFKQDLKKAKRILYLGDNAGEIVFDRVLIEEIKRMYPQKSIYYAVKEKPIINDALLADARVCGIDKMVSVISNGTSAPGTVLSLCSKGFKRIYKNADIIISKGQGNFESLSQEKRPIFFLFMVKCPVVAKETGCKIGDTILFYNQRYMKGSGK